MEKSGNGKKKSGKNMLSTIAVILIFMVGFGILLYPTFSNMWNKWRDSQLTNHYDETVSKISDKEKEKILEDARAYNAQHKVNTIVDAFKNSDDYILTHPYDTLLNPDGNEIMGYVEIPKISQKLSIYHGVGSDVLQKGVGHVEGTSLPVGGKSTHSVLAGHRGLPSAKLFTDLDQMKIGDQFYLKILDDTLAYEVDKISVVEPSDASKLQIVEGKDLVTLLTCTPYGVNTQRLLIRGHRVPYSEKAMKEQAGERSISDRDLPILLLVIALAVLFAIFILRRVLRAFRKNQLPADTGPRGRPSRNKKIKF